MNHPKKKQERLISFIHLCHNYYQIQHKIFIQSKNNQYDVTDPHTKNSPSNTRLMALIERKEREILY